MDQEKIGKFILELRKDKKMTQQELADKIGVTDRAISKWENGRGMPDISLMKPLCEILDITLNELISGEKIDKKEYQKKSDENIFKTIKYTNKKTNFFKKFLICLISVFLILILMFIIDVRKMNQNEEVVFSTWGFDYFPAINLNDEEIEIAVRNYLIEKGDNESKHYDGEKTFVSMRVFLLDEVTKDDHYNFYAWVLEGKYYLENNEIKESSASSIPYKFVIKKKDGKFIVVDYKIPRDGSYYPKDIKNIFPRDVRSFIDDVHSDGTIKRLQIDIDEQTKLYFHK